MATQSVSSAWRIVSDDELRYANPIPKRATNHPALIGTNDLLLVREQDRWHVRWPYFMPERPEASSASLEALQQQVEDWLATPLFFHAVAGTYRAGTSGMERKLVQEISVRKPPIDIRPKFTYYRVIPEGMCSVIYYVVKDIEQQKLSVDSYNETLEKRLNIPFSKCDITGLLTAENTSDTIQDAITVNGVSYARDEMTRSGDRGILSAEFYGYGLIVETSASISPMLHTVAYDAIPPEFIEDYTSAVGVAARSLCYDEGVPKALIAYTNRLVDEMIARPEQFPASKPMKVTQEIANQIAVAELTLQDLGASYADVVLDTLCETMSLAQLKFALRNTPGILRGAVANYMPKSKSKPDDETESTEVVVPPKAKLPHLRIRSYHVLGIISVVLIVTSFVFAFSALSMGLGMIAVGLPIGGAGVLSLYFALSKYAKSDE